MTLEEFKDIQGNVLAYPFNILPGQEIIGYSDIKFLTLDTVVSVETRSSTARKGLACLGFSSGTRTELFQNEKAQMAFLLKNYSPNSLRVSNPFSPVQISFTKEKSVGNYGTVDAHPIKLFRNGEDVTEKNKVSVGVFGMMDAYFVYLTDEMVYFQETGKPVDVEGDDIKRTYIKKRLDDIHRIKPGFCLTLTDEEIHTNGCPAYMLPFHYIDAIENPYSITEDSIADFVKRTFIGGAGLPVTANSGLINPGTHSKIVCENILYKGIDLEKYFRSGSPFALIVPLPFYDGSIDNDSYQSVHRNQNEIMP
ncbi:hypothetical protein COV19_00675 [Candidatus Woesearchaeota archaeon CG10_big_fil_rev_8_21_14_0_10_44_13]|nr:MAG: hypothetical protein COV19_00675 [Candidatus Woesearchaeota archaeon CG10_big_fil_rev_8_21_14_0_10_44_13]